MNAAELIRTVLPFLSSPYPVYFFTALCFLAVLGMGVLHKNKFRRFFLNTSIPFILLGLSFNAMGSRSMILRFVPDERMAQALVNLLPQLLSAFLTMGYVYLGAGALCLLVYGVMKST